MTKIWKCRKCEHLVVAEDRPFIKWDDGHVCAFYEEKADPCWLCEESDEIWDCGLCHKCYWWVDKQGLGELGEDEIKEAYSQWRDQQADIEEAQFWAAQETWAEHRNENILSGFAPDACQCQTCQGYRREMARGKSTRRS
ncbi:MAG: hypothetical protein GTO24_21035 [candidate division Zixibacteria bacterium]|nr:hypothetical protein [candidate division Zixibacteria bacterium]